jgi:HPt (histidine-containing phosphotransfer) domain-containing protein
MLNKYVRDKQQPEAIEQARAQCESKKPSFPNITADPELNKRFSEVFVRDARRSIAVLDAFVKKGAENNESDIKTNIIHTHGMKSALANMGKVELSSIAQKLEILGRESNIEALLDELPAFISSLKTYVSELALKGESAGSDTVIEDKQLLTDMMQKIKAACEAFDEDAAEEILTQLKKSTWSKQTKELINKIDEQLLHCDFDEIISDINKFIPPII